MPNELKLPLHRATFDPTFYCAIIFVAGLILLEEYFFAAGYREFIAQAPLGIFSLKLNFITQATIEVIILFVFVRESFLARIGLRIVYVLLLAVPLVTQYAYLSSLGRYITSLDFSLLGTSISDFKAALRLYVSWGFLAPVLVYISLLTYLRKNRRKSDIIAFIFVLLCILTFAFKPIRYSFTSQSLVDLNFGSSILRFYETALQRLVFSKFADSRDSLPTIQSNNNNSNLLIVIDESIRADHLSINNYSRETTPYLEYLAANGYLKNFGIAVAGATCSPLSNAMLITGVRPSKTSLKESSIRPTIFQYAKALNYKTTYIDAQSDILWTGLKNEDLAYIDKRIRSSELGAEVYRDYTAAQIIKDILSNSSKNLILLNKRGVHFMYEDSYPKGETIWAPMPPNGDYINFPSLVINPYDNGIRFALDGFFRRLLANPRELLAHTNIIYTSDHGQTLFENGESWSHCNYKPIEAAVPMFILSSKYSNFKKIDRAAHFSVLPTLSMMGVVNLDSDIMKHSLVGDQIDTICPCFVSGALSLVCSC